MASSQDSDIAVIEYARAIWPDFSITQHQLINITSDFVISFYQKFKDTLAQFNEKICDGSRANIVPKPKGDTPFTLFRFINKYLKGIISDGNTASNLVLTITDLYDPTYKRSVIKLFALLQFLTYYESNIEDFKSIVSRKFESLEELKLKKTTKDNIKGSIANQVEEVVGLQKLLTKLGNDKEQVKARYEKLQSIKDDIDRRNKKMRFDLKAIVDTYNTKQTLLTNVKANIHSLNEQIVTEDSFKSMLDLKNNIIKSCTELDNKSSHFSQHLQRRKPDIEHFEEIEALIGDLLKTGGELKIVQTSAIENSDLLKSLLLNYNESSLKLKKYNQDNVKLANSTQVKTEAVHLEAVKHKTMQSNIERDVQQITIEIEKKEKESAKEQHLHENKISDYEKIFNDVESSIQRLNLIYEDTYKNMLHSANAVTTNIHTSVNKLSSLFKE